MKYLILTASTGEGHNQAARNLKLEIEKNNDECIIIDLFKKSNFEIIIEKGFETLVQNLPHIYGAFYKMSDNKFFNKIFLKNVFIKFTFSLNNLIKKEKPDVIISTHPFAVPIITRIKKYLNLKIPFIQIITDFKAHYTYIDKRVDAYITGSEYTRDSLVKRGVDPSKVFSFGIPVKEEFKTKNEVNNDKFNILIMGGSLGIKDMEKSIISLMNSNLDIHTTVICGKNEKLKNKLQNIFKDNNKIEVLGYTKRISTIMDNSKLLITKPGGLTSSEAINKNIPMIIPFSFPGQEKENTNFLVNSNMAIEVKNIEYLPEYIELLIKDKDFYDSMVKNMKQISKGYSIESILKLAKNLKMEKGD